MDERIAFVTSLKNHISQRASIQSITVPASSSPSNPSAEEAEYHLVRKQIEDSAFYGKTCSKHVRIRLDKWLKRLDQVGSNRVWATNRNNYLKLLSLMCHCGILTRPFLTLPPNSDLPHLPKHEIMQIIDQVQREIKTSRMTSRKASINYDTAVTRQKAPLINEHKRFQTESNTFGEDDSDTLLLRHWNTRTFQTDFQDKTISFNLSSTEKNWFSKQTDIFQLSEQQEEEHQEPHLDRYKTRPLRATCHSSSKQLRQITNQVKQADKSKNGFRKKSKPPLYKQIKLSGPKEETQKKRNGSICRNKEYWESNEATNNNSGVGTPKYLDKYQLTSQNFNNSVVIVSYREGDTDNCDCTSKMLGEGWLSQMFKKITL